MGVRNLGHQLFLSKTLWRFQNIGLLTDVTIVCSDGEVQVHRAMMVNILRLWRIPLEGLGAKLECLIIPEVSTEDIKDAMKTNYLDFDVSKIFGLFRTFKEEIVQEKCNQISEDLLEQPGDNDDNSSFESPYSKEKNTEEIEINDKTGKRKLNQAKGKRGRPKGKRDMSKRKISTFKCEDCDIKMKGRLTFKKHQMKYHDLQENNLTTNCPYCEKGLSNIYNYNMHIVLLHREKAHLHPEIVFKKDCTECDEKFYKIFDLNKHSKSVHGKSLRTLKCKFCDEKLTNRAKLRIHMLALHMDQLGQSGLSGYVKNVPCPYCSELFTTKSYINHHIYKRHTDKLEQHPEIKLNYSCEQCNKHFLSKCDLQDHNAVNHGMELPCRFCDKKFTHISSRRSHIAENHKNEKNMCEQCPKVFKTNAAVRKHIRVSHSKQPYKYPCCNCSQGAMSEEGLQSHNENKHGSKQFLCSYCSDTFNTSKNMKLHVARMHTEKNIQCDQCEKMFPNLKVLNLHIKNVHLRMCVKICPICDKEINGVNVYKCHMNRHNGIRPCSCETCSKSYLTNRDLKKHQNVHTLPFKCHLCEKSFSAKDILADHMRKHAGEKLDCRHLCGNSYLEETGTDMKRAVLTTQRRGLLGVHVT